MATVAGIKVKIKPPRERRVAFADEKHTGSEPVWDTERALTFSDADFDHHLRRSFNYYNYHYNQKDCKKHVVEWMQRQEKAFTKEDLKAFIRASDRSLSMTACSLVMAHRQGMPLKPRHLEFLNQAIRTAIGSAEPEVEEVVAEKVKAYVPTIQDRLNEKTAENIGELEGMYDDFVTDKKEIKTYDFLVANNVPQSQLGKFEEVFQKRFDELKAAYEKQDEQLVEGYKYLKAADFKRIFVQLDKMLNDIEQYRGVKKATKKVRAPRAVSKEKVVAKLKYAKDDKALKLVSINPVDILNTQELWVYNVKTRKLGRYVADSLQGPLSVKGTSVTGFDTAKSISKTLRKPDEKLKEFAKAGKIQLRKFMDDIKATSTVLNGRISADIVLLKAI